MKTGQIKERWSLKHPCPEDYLVDSSFSRVEKQLLYNRDLQTVEQVNSFLDPKYEDLLDPLELNGVKEAVARITTAIEENEKVAVYGDYDVDGIAATCILHDTFQQLGADVLSYIPSREDEGYGVNVEAVRELAAKGVSLIVTVDCGVTAVDEVEEAKKQGIDIIVTDHHAIPTKEGKQILPATIVINPKKDLPTRYPYPDLSGSGVAFKLASALLKDSKESEKWLLDLAALGTICDVVPLVGENRVIAKYGLVVLSKTRRRGLRALFESAGLDRKNITAYNVGFQIGPRLNAAGRLKTAEIALSLLLTSDTNEAIRLSAELTALNQERQAVTQKILEEATEQISLKDKSSKLFLLSKENWPKGVVGIVASRLTEAYSRPVIVFEEKDGLCTGSARSTANFNIVDALSCCSEFLIKYGGHSRAAGLSLKKEHFVMLEDKLLSITDKAIAEEDLIPEYQAEATLEMADIGENLYKFLERLEPYGFGNPTPTFILNDVLVETAQLVGKLQNHLKVSFSSGGSVMKGIFFNWEGAKGAEIVNSRKNILFRLSKNEWNGVVSFEAKGISIQ